MARRKGRGRLSSIDLLPPECDPIIAEAASALSENTRTQQDIYDEFYTKLGELMADSGGALKFEIPSKSAFNRYSLRQAATLRRLAETRELAQVVSEKFDVGTSDDLTVIIVELLKTVIYEMLEKAGEAGFEPKEAMQLATAAKSTLQASAISTERRRKIEKDIEGKLGEAVDKAGKARGFSSDTVKMIKDEIMGVIKK